MHSANSVLFRQWLILSKIPKHPRRIGTSEVKDFLANHGLSVSSRMIQRDLESLSSTELFPLSCETEGRRNLWFWPPSAKPITLPIMDTSIALSFLLAKEYLSRIFPIHVLTELEPYFLSAQDTIKTLSPSSEDWKNKVAVIHDGPDMIKPSSDDQVIEAIYESLFKGRQIQAVYKPRGNQKKTYIIHPLGIVAKSGTFYLTGLINDFDDVRQFSLSRFVSAETLDADARILEGFSLQEYVKGDHAFQYPLDPQSTKLSLKVNKDFEFFFRESALAKDQIVSEIDQDHLLVQATVVISEELEWWVLGRAPLIEVLEPCGLRKRIAERLAKAHAQYNKSSNDA